MAGQTFRLGLIVPSSNTVMEADLQRELAAVATIHPVRLFLEEAGKEAEQAMIDDGLPLAMQMLRSLKPHLAIFGSTSAGSLYGLGFDSALAHRIEDGIKGKVLTVLSAVQQELKQIKAKKLAVITPYLDELNWTLRNCLEEMGHAVLSLHSMGLTRHFDMGMVPPQKLIQHCRESLRKTQADTIFIAGTNLRALEALPALRKRFRQSILTSNQAVIATIKRMIKKGQLKPPTVKAR